MKRAGAVLIAFMVSYLVGYQVGLQDAAMGARPRRSSRA